MAEYLSDLKPHPEAIDLWRAVRDKDCDRCPLGALSRHRCLLGNGPVEHATAMVVMPSPTGDDVRRGFPLHGDNVRYFEHVARGDLGLDLDDVYVTYAVKCWPAGEDGGSKRDLAVAQRECDDYLAAEILRVRPTAVLALGAPSYFFFTHQAGVTKHRGQAFEWTHPDDPTLTVWVVPALDPNAVFREPRHHSGFVSDVSKWSRLARGETVAPTVEVIDVRSFEAFQAMQIELWSDPDSILSFDLETRGFQSERSTSRVWGAGITQGKRNADGAVRVWNVAIEHPDAPWYDEDGTLDLSRGRRRYVIEGVVDLLLRYARGVNGHNVKFDLRWARGLARRHGLGDVFGHAAFDTMVAAHLIDEQQELNLLNQASTLLGVDDWGKGNQLFGTMPGDVQPHEILARNVPYQPTEGRRRPRVSTNNGKGSHLGDWWGPEGLGRYCALDTGYAHLLMEKQVDMIPAGRDDRRHNPRVVAKYLVLPGLETFDRIEAHGVYVHWDRVAEHRAQLRATVDRLHGELAEYLNGPFAEEPDLGNDNFLRAWLFGWHPAATLERMEERRASAAADLLQAREEAEHYETPANLHRVERLVEKTRKLNQTKVDEERRRAAEAAASLGLTPTSYTPTGMPQVDETALGTLRHPALSLLNEERGARKLLNYFDQWEEWQGDDRRIHPYTNLTGTATGRRSVANPPLQQIPRNKLVRTCLGAPPGWVFLEVDFSQLEVRIAAWLAGEDTLLEIFRTGRDVYSETAAAFLGKEPHEVTGEERRKAKAYVLGFLYGMGAKGFVAYALKTFGVVVTQAEAEVARAQYFALYPKLVHWHRRYVQMANRPRPSTEPVGHYVESLVGRRRNLSNIKSGRSLERGDAERQAINSPVQGFGGDWTLAAAIELVMEKLDPARAHAVGDIHDALLFELRADTWREDARTIMEVMESPRIMREIFQLEPPVQLLAEGKVGDAWGAGNEFTLTGTDKLPSLDDVEVAA